MESEVDYLPAPVIGFSFAACHLPLSYQADGFQLLVDSRSPKHFIDSQFIRGVETRMQYYTNKTNLPRKVKATGGNILYGTAQNILLVVARDADDVCERVKLPVVNVPGLKRNLFPRVAAVQKDVKTVINMSGSYL